LLDYWKISERDKLLSSIRTKKWKQGVSSRGPQVWAFSAHLCFLPPPLLPLPRSLSLSLSLTLYLFSLSLSSLCKHFLSFIKPPAFHSSGSPSPFIDFFRLQTRLSSASKSHWSEPPRIHLQNGWTRSPTSLRTCRSILWTKRGGRNVFSLTTSLAKRMYSYVQSITPVNWGLKLTYDWKLHISVLKYANTFIAENEIIYNN